MIWREARRFLQGAPILTLSAIGVLALGTGASGLALALLLAFSSPTYPGMRALGYATIAEQTEGGGSMPVSWQSFEKLRVAPTQNTDFAAYSQQITTALDIGGKSRPLEVAAISRGFFSIFTPRLSAGRDFSQTEEGDVGAHVTILSFPLAVDLFKSQAAALNQFVKIDGLPFRVVGVAPAGFGGLFGNSAQAWVPASCVIPLKLNPPRGFGLSDAWRQMTVFYIATASRREASKELVTELSQSLPLRTAADEKLHVSRGLTIDPARDARAREWLRLGLLVALAFTIVCGLNFSLLLLARVPRLADEVRLKRALGAGSGRLAAELMAGPAVTVGAGLLAASVTWAGTLAVISRISPFSAQLIRGSFHATLLAFGIQLPITCALALSMALIPAFGALRDVGVPRLETTSTATRRTGALLQALVTAQIALCIVTWILAGMIVSTVVSVTNRPLGYDPSHLSAVYIGPGPGGVTFSTGSGRTFPGVPVIRGLLDRVNGLPDVRSAAFAGDAPLVSAMGTVRLQRTGSALSTPLTVNQTAVSPDYFRAIGSTIIRGREFSWKGLAGTTNEVIVNEALAKELWHGTDPVGRSVTLTYPGFSGIPSFSATDMVIGVVEDMHFTEITESPQPTVFESLKGSAFVTSYLIANGTAPAHSLEDLVNRQLSAHVPALHVLRVYSIRDRARASRWKVEKRAYCALAGALLMALIAYIGLYGALAYYVNTRRRELAVRICLGAVPSSIRKIVLARSARCALLAAVLSAPLWALLVQLSASDYLGKVSWSTPRAVLLSLGCIALALLVSLIPARAAMRVSPVEVLKEL